MSYMLVIIYSWSEVKGIREKKREAVPKREERRGGFLVKSAVEMEIVGAPGSRPFFRFLDANLGCGTLALARLLFLFQDPLPSTLARFSTGLCFAYFEGSIAAILGLEKREIWGTRGRNLGRRLDSKTWDI